MATLPEKEAARTSREAPSDSTRDSRRVGTGWDLVTTLETHICGSSFVGSASVAEGYAISGLQSASFERKIPGLISFELLDRPVVHHVRYDSDTLLDPDLWCVLVAGNHQHVLQHSLAAHAISSRTARPVLAVQDRSLSESLGWVEWPDETVIEAIQQGPGSALSSTFEASDQPTAIEEILDSVLQKTGVSISALEIIGKKDAAELIVGMGSVLHLLENFSDDSFGLLSVRLLRPFPEASFRRLVKGKKKLFVPYLKRSPIHQELLDAVKKIGRSEKVEIVPLELGRSLSQSESAPERINEMVGKPVIRAEEASFSQNIGISPGSAWGKSVILEALSAHSKLLRLGRSRLVENPVMTELIGRESSEELDMLVLLRNEVVDPQVPLRRLSRFGNLLLGGTKEALEAWDWLGETGRNFVVENEIELHWMSVGDRSQEVSQVVMRCLRENTIEIHPEDSVVEKLDPETLSASLDSKAEAFLVSGSLPLLKLASGAEEEDKDRFRADALSFHFSSGRETSDRPHLPLAPAALLGLKERVKQADHFPLLISDERVLSLRSFLEEKLTNLKDGGTEFSILSRSLDALVELISKYAGPQRPIKEAVDVAFERASDFFDLSSEALVELEKEMESLKPSLSADAVLIKLNRQAHFHLLEEGVLQARLKYRQRWLSEIESQIVELDNLLRSDRELSSEYSSAEAIDSSIGGGGLFIDTARLSKALPAKRGSTGLGQDRRHRIERARESLNEFVQELRQLPPYYVIQPQNSGSASRLNGNILFHSDPFGLAQGLYSGFQARAVEAARASRIATLEISGEYDESTHNQRIANFTVDACSEEELLSLPPVVVSTTSEFLSKEDFTGFARLLSSGQPVYVLISCSDLDSKGEGASGILDGDSTDLGYLAMAHREAFVLQAPLSEFRALSDGLRRMLKRIRPGVAVVGLPEVGESLDPLELSTLSHAVRALPTFEYDPDAGESWADRFRLVDNPEVDEVFCEVEIDYIDSSGEKGRLTEKVTLGHRLAMDPRFRNHFKLAVEAQSEDLIELGNYLERFEETPPEGIPYIWVLGEEFELQRALVTREVVRASRNRQKGWRVLQELAGLNNEYVLEAIESTRKEVEARVEAEKESALKKARSEGASEAVDRLVTVLMNPEAAQSVSAIDKVSVVSAQKEKEEKRLETEAAPEAEAPSEPEASEQEPEEEFFEDPYIESYLCTSCNDCINLNSRMFKYNQDNQAFIADPEAGTYLELVKAAEVCPANCIHPGAPRPGDETATDEVVKRAKAIQ